VTIAVRVDGDEAAKRLLQLASAIRPGGSPPTVTNVRDQIDASLAEPMFTMRVLAAFAALGVVLAAIGLFGVVSYSVSQRTREIGVRMALGAAPSSIARLVAGSGLRLVLLGTVVGLTGASTLTRSLRSLLYGVPALDPVSFGTGAALLILVALVACIVPVLRATAVDPSLALRAD
jgi:putative ABC transport system permease protein